MDRVSLKQKAMLHIQTARPNPCLVTLVLLIYGWLISYLSQRVGGQPLYMDLDALAAMDSEHVFGMDWSNVTLLGSLILLAFELVSAILDMGYYRYTLNVSREKPAGFSDLLAGFDFPFKTIVLWFLSRIIVSLLMLLLIVPGLVMNYAYFMAPRLLADHPDWSPVRCLRESRKLMNGHKWELFVLHLSFLGWVLLTIVPFTSVFVQPYIHLTESEYYLRLISPDDDPSPEEKDPWEY